MLADTRGGRSIQQQIKAIFCHSVKFSSGEENKRQKDAEAQYHFQNLFLFLFLFFFSFTSNRTDIHWHMQSEHFVVLFHYHPNPIEQRLDIYFCTPNMKILSNIYKKNILTMPITLTE